ncbi:MAG: methyl-accepting chemotaxis protein [Burkholderiales bacterium]|nr:methyl-accepting chemotaxis protein [Nitrosomonadaceae bacterium]
MLNPSFRSKLSHLFAKLPWSADKPATEAEPPSDALDDVISPVRRTWLPQGISARLVLLVATSVVALVLVGGAGFWGMHRLQSENRALIDGEIAQVVRLAELGQLLAKLRQAEKDIVIEVADPRRVEEFAVRWEAAYKDATLTIADLKKAGQRGTKESMANLESIEQRATAYAKGFRDFASRAKNGEFKDSLDAADASMAFKSSTDEAENLARVQLDKERAQSRARGDALEVMATVTERAILIALALATIISVLMGVVIVRSVRSKVASAKRIAQTIASGDLSKPVHVDGDDELAQLLRALSEMQGGLDRVVREIRDASENIHTVSAEIAMGNDHLSSRTEAQASSLEQTSNSLEGLTEKVRRNTDETERARGVVSATSTAADQGGAMVRDVVSNMGQISTASKKIGDIIGVIDGIAFQTNILALNAAVEAARAGEQGRGFAVVAGEVRTLAQRSADAAKEIKALIANSMASVEAGNKLVARTGDTINGVVERVREVSDIISGIATATAAQKRGIEEVSGAVTDIGETTQQNAALVEQSAAAAASLKLQAARLNQAVQAFRLQAD